MQGDSTRSLLHDKPGRGTELCALVPGRSPHWEKWSPYWEKSCTSSGKGGKKRKFICRDFSQLPIVKHYSWSEHLTLLHSWVASGYLRCQIPCPVGSMSSKSGNDEKRQTGHVASECQRASDIVHKTCSHSMILFFSFIRRGNLAQWAKTIPKVTWLVSGKFRIWT